METPQIKRYQNFFKVNSDVIKFSDEKAKQREYETPQFYDEHADGNATEIIPRQSRCSRQEQTRETPQFMEASTSTAVLKAMKQKITKAKANLGGGATYNIDKKEGGNSFR